MASDNRSIDVWLAVIVPPEQRRASVTLDITGTNTASLNLNHDFTGFSLRNR